MAAILTAASGSACAALPYAKLASNQATFEALPASARDKLILNQRVVHKDPANHTPIHLWVSVSGSRVDIPVAADGTMTITPRQDWVVRGASVENDQPPGTLLLQMEVAIATPRTMPI